MTLPIQLVLHIGQHKTGSKALQSFLYYHASKLTQYGILYPQHKIIRNIKAYNISHFYLYALLKKEALLDCHDENSSKKFWQTYRPFCKPYQSISEAFNKIEIQRKKINAHTIIISAEDLFDMQSTHEIYHSPQLIRIAARHLANIAKHFSYTPKIVIYVRRQDHLLAAHYAQYIKGSDTNTLTFSEFTQEFLPRLNTTSILNTWLTHFDHSAFHIRSYEKETLPQGIVPDFFYHVLKINLPTSWQTPPPDIESSNITPNHEYIEFIRLLNIKKKQNLSIPPRDIILETAFKEHSQKPNIGINAWLSPKEQFNLLQQYEDDNKKIVQQFFNPPKSTLFQEAYPNPHNPIPTILQTLTAERAIEIVLNLQKESRPLRKYYAYFLLFITTINIMIFILQYFLF